jgi:hypothetical protein
MKIRASAALLLVSFFLAATEPNDATRRWWHYVTALANDSMEGRDTGLAAYKRAAHYVATEFEQAGVQPAGEQGYFQSVTMRRVQLNTVVSDVALEHKTGVANWLGSAKLPWPSRRAFRRKSQRPWFSVALHPSPQRGST